MIGYLLTIGLSVSPGRPDCYFETSRASKHMFDMNVYVGPVSLFSVLYSLH